MYRVLVYWHFGVTLWDTLFETVEEAKHEVEEHSEEHDINLRRYKIVKVVGEWKNVLKFVEHE